jgi:hypothetical protein
MLPGGVTTPASSRHIIDSLSILNKLTRWFEQAIIGTDLDAWLAIQSADEFFTWLTAKDAHADSAIGLFTLMSRDIGLHNTGFGTPHMISYGAYDDPDDAGTFPRIASTCSEPVSSMAIPATSSLSSKPRLPSMYAIPGFSHTKAVAIRFRGKPFLITNLIPTAIPGAKRPAIKIKLCKPARWQMR